MTIRKIIFLGFILIIFFSCKKDKLTGDRAMLIGKWKLLYLIEQSSSAHPMYDTLYTINGTNDYSIEFEKEGNVIFCTGGDLERKRAVFVAESEILDYFSFDVYLNNNIETSISFRVKDNILITRNYFPPRDPNKEIYGLYNAQCYFIKE